MRRLHGECFSHRNGYWTYKVCVGKSAEQAHYEKNEPVMSIPLGSYDTTGDGTVDLKAATDAFEVPEPEPAPPPPKPKDGGPAKKPPKPPQQWQTLVMPRGSDPILAQRYRGGDGSRSSTLYFQCSAPDALPHVLRRHARASGEGTVLARVEEKPLHHYHFLLLSPMLCDGRERVRLVIEREIAKLRGHCLTRKSHAWWSYEVCLQCVEPV